MAILRKPELKAEFGWRSDASVSSAVRGGLLTKPVQIGPRSVAWPDYEVKAIITARIAGRSDDAIRDLVSRLHTQRAELTLA